MKRNTITATLIASLLILGSVSVLGQEVYIGGSEEDDWSEPSYDSARSQQDNYDQYNLNDDGLPIVYAGDGMTITIRSIDPNTELLRGEIALQSGRPMPLVMEVQTDWYGNETGVGQVNTPQGPRLIRSRDESEEVTLAEFNGRTYRLTYQANAAPPRTDYRQPAPPPRSNQNADPYQNNSNPRPAVVEPVRRPAADARENGTVTLTSHTLNDRRLNNMPSHTLLAPKGWKVEGGGWWPPAQATKWMPSYEIKVTGDDGTLVHFEPMFEAVEITSSGMNSSPAPQEGSVRDGYPVMSMPQDLNGWKDFLVRRGIPAMYPGATNIQVTKAEQVPELTAMARRTLQAQQANVPPTPPSPGIRTYRDAVVFSIELTFTHQGKQWDQQHIFTNEFHGVDNQMLGRQVFWNTHGSIVFRAPKGQLRSRMPLLMTIVHSLRMKKEWMVTLLQHQAKIRNISHEINMAAINGIAQRAGIVSSALSDINRNTVEGGQRRDAINDTGQRNIVNSILDSRDYAEPGTNTTVSLSNQYERVFSNGNGEYILTNDVSYNPGADPNLNGNWQRMTATN